jgi:hypothetical protein
MAGTVIADRLEAASTSQLVIRNGVALTPPTIADVNGVAIGTFCRAWVNFNGTGTVAIRASFNVSSITDNGTGQYAVNFTTAMLDVNYAAIGNMNTAGTGVGTANDGQVSPYLYAVGSIAIATMDGGGTLGDKAWISVAVFR